MNITQYLLAASEEKLRENVTSTLSHRSAAWSDYLVSKGGVDGLIETSLRRQNDMIKLADTYKSYIPTTIINIDGKRYNDIVSDIIFSRLDTNTLGGSFKNYLLS